MKIFYTIATLLLLFSSCATKKFVDTSNNWTSVAVMEETEIFIDASTIKRTGDLIVAKEKKVFTTASSKAEYLSRIRARYVTLGNVDKANNWADFSYTIYTSEYDCSNSRFRVMQVEDFDSQGNRIVKATTEKKNLKWLDVDKQTVGDYTFFFVCDYDNN